jgi:ADP-ribose pyrophosphatase
MIIKEKTIATHEVFHGNIISVHRDDVVLENGISALREVVEHSGGVCILPLTEDNQVHLVRQFRYPFQTGLLEVPAGKKELGEDPLSCGIRELKEEVGATADEMIPLGKMLPTPAYDTECIYLYLARGLHYGKQHLDSDEFLDVETFPLADLKQMVMANEIDDAKTQLIILKACAFLGI